MGTTRWRSAVHCAGGGGVGEGAAPPGRRGARHRPPPPPPPRTKWTRRVPHPVLIGHAASLTPYGLGADRTDTCPACSIAAESRAARRTASVAAVATSVLGPPVDATARGDTSCAGPRARWRVRATQTAACRAGPVPGWGRAVRVRLVRGEGRGVSS